MPSRNRAQLSGPGHKLGHKLLSDRELEILTQMAKGMVVKEIARALHISDKTVRNHLSHIYSKTGVYDRAAMVVWAMKEGLVSGESLVVRKREANGGILATWYDPREWALNRLAQALHPQRQRLTGYAAVQDVRLRVETSADMPPETLPFASERPGANVSVYQAVRAIRAGAAHPMAS